MGTIKFDVPHSLPIEEAQKRVAKLTALWATQYGIKTQWVGNDARVAGKVKGLTLDAAVQVTGSAVNAEATDPGLLLRGPAKKYLTSQFAAYLDPKKSLADLGEVEG